MQSVAELKANLAQYREQSEQVNSLLALDPGNEQYQKLKSDLEDAVRLTEELLRQQQGGGGVGAAAASSTVPTGELQLRKGAAAAAGPWTPSVGDRVEAPYGDKRYPAVILALDEADDTTATIKYYGYPDVEVKPRSDLTPLTYPPGEDSVALGPGEATIGFQCQALWIGDGKWYDATVAEIVEHGYKVKFIQYGTEGEVPWEYLRARPAGAAAAAASSRPPKRPAAGSDAPKEFVIPDNLRLLPTDSEEERARKRKKVKHLKTLWKQRHQKDDDGAEAGETKSWKDYLNKSKKKPAVNKGLGALKKGSIFASPDTVDGKVGVVGSGQGMTGFDKRKAPVKGRPS